MDRSLVAGAILLLFLEIGLLLVGLDEVPNFQAPGANSATQGQLLGQMKRTESHVRRRASSSLVWEESQARDPLYEFDSVLTLSGSTAQIQFNSNTVLNIDENTLVVLEENHDRKDGSLRIRFSRGVIRSKNPSRPLEIKSEAWTLTAAEGSVVNLISLTDGRFDLELTEGRARLDSEETSQEINRGERLSIRDSQIEDKKQLDDDLAWSEKLPTRIYSHGFPVEIELKWRGAAAALRLIKPDKTEETIALERASDSEPEHSRKLALNEGTYLVSLGNNGRSSETLTLQVRRAPLFRYYSPLPRNRARTGVEPTFSWETSAFATHYRLELSPVQDFSSDVRSWKLDTPRFTTKLENEGAFFWRVIGLDDEETPIPEPRIYPLYITPDPLQSPRLNAPSIRSPASPPEDSSENPISTPPPQGHRSGARLWRWLPLLTSIPTAFASENPEHAKDSDFTAVFSWSSIEGANHYIIEISKSPGFEEPIVMQRVSSPRFIWHGFTKGVYFWRVAAGQTTAKGERLGLFSAVAVANLESLETFAGPGVTLASPRPKENPAPALVAKKTEEPPTPVPSVPPPPSPSESEPRRSGTWRKHLAWHPSYRLVDAEGAQGIQGSFSGPSLLAFETEIQFTSPTTRLWSLRLTYDETEWRPKDTAATPFQSSVKEQHASADLFVGREDSAWRYGLGAELLPVLRRAGAEKGELQILTVIGPSARYLKNITEHNRFDFLLSSRFGEIIGLRLRADWRFDLTRTERALYTLSPSLSYGHFQKDDTKLRDLQMGLNFALEW